MVRFGALGGTQAGQAVLLVKPGFVVFPHLCPDVHGRTEVFLLLFQPIFEFLVLGHLLPTFDHAHQFGETVEHGSVGYKVFLVVVLVCGEYLTH